MKEKEKNNIYKNFIFLIISLNLYETKLRVKFWKFYIYLLKNRKDLRFPFLYLKKFWKFYIYLLKNRKDLRFPVFFGFEKFFFYN